MLGTVLVSPGVQATPTWPVNSTQTGSRCVQSSRDFSPKIFSLCILLMINVLLWARGLSISGFPLTRGSVSQENVLMILLSLLDGDEISIEYIWIPETYISNHSRSLLYDSEKSSGLGVKTLGHSPGSVLFFFFLISKSVNF